MDQLIGIGAILSYGLGVFLCGLLIGRREAKGWRESAASWRHACDRWKDAYTEAATALQSVSREAETLHARKMNGREIWTVH